ncbi:MAG: dihydropteroate synthase [Candidatus Eisenbacteria bacterium]
MATIAARSAGTWRVRGREFDLARRALVMGVLNVTPDSFSDQGRYADPGAALERALAMIEEGADLIDVGGESTRPGAPVVPVEVEIARVRPVLERLVPRSSVPVSIDTRKTEVARVALDLGAAVLNDVSGLRVDPAGGGGHERARLAAEHGAGLVLMHMQGEPATMQDDPRYDDVLGEVKGFLFDAARRAEEAGVPRAAIALDPGIGFGKAAAHSLLLLRGTAELAAAGYPVLVGVSKKSLFGKLFGLALEDRAEAGLAASVACVLRGARIVRTHDVRATARALRVAEALL